MSTEDVPVFNGTSSQGCEEFTVAVTRKMYADKNTDDQDIARYVATRLEGKAFRWYVSLSVEVQESWRLLRQALLDQYAAEEEEESESPSTIPVPAAAAAPPPAAVPEPSSLSPPAHTTTAPAHSTPSTYVSPLAGYGHIVIEAENASYWVGRELHDEFGYFKRASTKKEALKVKFEPGATPAGPHRIKLSDTSFRNLGLAWNKAVVGETEWPSTWARLCGVDRTLFSFGASVSYSYRKPPLTATDCWVFKSDGTIAAMWKGTELVAGVGSQGWPSFHPPGKTFPGEYRAARFRFVLA